MTALYIICAILFLLLLLLFIKVTFSFSYYYYGSPQFSVKILFKTLRFDIGEGTHEDETETEKELKRRKAEKKAKEGVEKEKEGSPSLKDSLNRIKTTLQDFLRKYRKYTRLERFIVKISVASEDPSDTAIQYGAVSALCGAIYAFVVSIKKRSKKADDLYMEVKPDFFSVKPDVALDIAFSLRIWQLLSCGLTAYKGYKSLNKSNSKKNKKRGGKSGSSETPDKNDGKTENK